MITIYAKRAFPLPACVAFEHNNNIVLAHNRCIYIGIIYAYNIIHAHGHSPACYIITAVDAVVIGRFTSSWRSCTLCPGVPPTPTISYYLHDPLPRTPRRRIWNSPGDRPWCQQPVNARYINVGINTRRCLYILGWARVCVYAQCIYETSPATEATQKRTPPHSSECRKQSNGPATNDDDDDDATTDGYIRFF